MRYATPIRTRRAFADASPTMPPAWFLPNWNGNGHAITFWDSSPPVTTTRAAARQIVWSNYLPYFGPAPYNRERVYKVLAAQSMIAPYLAETGADAPSPTAPEVWDAPGSVITVERDWPSLWPWVALAGLGIGLGLWLSRRKGATA